jgi:hypothetical protein
MYRHGQNPSAGGILTSLHEEAILAQQVDFTAALHVSDITLISFLMTLISFLHLYLLLSLPQFYT